MMPSTERIREQSQTKSEKTGVLQTCPECDGEIRRDEVRGESICQLCGLVVGEYTIDHGPEWRSNDDGDSRSRVGSPLTNLRHDKGLSTQISWQNKDARGNGLSYQKQRKFNRLRRWDQRANARSPEERGLKHALGEIERMSSALGLPKPTRQIAAQIYRRAADDNLLPGRSIEGIATAGVYAAARIDGVPRTLEEVAVVSRVDQQRIERAYRYMKRELSLSVPLTDPREYMTRIASETSCTMQTEQQARALIDKAVRSGVHVGKSPVSIAASSIYAGAKMTDDPITQSEIAAAANVSEVTIRTRYRELLKLDSET